MNDIPNRLASQAHDSMQPRPIVLALAAAGLVASLPVFAQSQAPSTTDVEPVQTITVTAGKRVEKQREVAGTVSVVQGNELERRGARDQEDVFKLTPGVQINKGDPSSNGITIRGLGTAGCSICGGLQQGTTGIYLMDVPQTDPFGTVSVLDIAPFDLERIEILRGPQGALYGSSSLGGAIRYQLNRPNLKEREASILGSLNTVSGGEAGYSVYGMLNLPLSAEAAAIRVVAFDRKDGGYIDNLGTGKNDANELRQQGGRVMFGIKPTKAFTVNLTVMTQKTESDDSFAVSPDAAKLQKSTPSASTRSAQFDFANLQLDYDLGAHTLTSNTGWTEKSVHMQYDSTRIYGGIGAAFGLPALPVITAPSGTKQDATSQELRIASNGRSALSYVAGVFYQRTSYDSDGRIVAPGGAALWGAMGPVLLANDVMVTSVGTAKATETAVFVDGEYALGNDWSVGLGGRQYRTSLEYVMNATFFGNPLVSASPSTSERGFTPKATIKYRFGESLWYALASKGYRFGGVNAAAPFKPYKSDSLWNYETGVRLNPAKGLQLDLTAFLLDWTDAQVTAYDTSGAVPIAATVNIGKARNTGLEALLQYTVNSVFRLSAALAYTEAKTAQDYASGAVPGSIIASGSRLPSTPKWQSALQANYTFSGPMQTQGRFNATHTYVGSRVMDIDGFTKAAGYGTLDLGLSFARGSWTVSAGLANAFDKRGVVGIIGGTPGLPYQDYFIQRPRTLSASLRWDM